MKKLIICEENNPFIDSLRKCREFAVVTSKSYFRVADGIVFYHPDINQLVVEVHKKRNTRIIILVHDFRVQVFKALFKNILVLSDSSENIVLEIEHYFKTPFCCEELQLSEKEHTFLAEYSYGISLKEMCYVMNMSYRSIRRLRQRLLEKTGLESGEQLTLYALLHSLMKYKQ